jgi:hypothetical protein
MNDPAADFAEEISIGADRLIPVFNIALPQLAMGQYTRIPYFAYPPDVFFGRMILSLIIPLFQTLPKADTVLTRAAVEMAPIAVDGRFWCTQCQGPHLLAGFAALFSAPKALHFACR